MITPEFLFIKSLACTNKEEKIELLSQAINISKEPSNVLMDAYVEQVGEDHIVKTLNDSTFEISSINYIYSVLQYAYENNLFNVTYQKRIGDKLYPLLLSWCKTQAKFEQREKILFLCSVLICWHFDISEIYEDLIQADTIYLQIFDLCRQRKFVQAADIMINKSDIDYTINTDVLFSTIDTIFYEEFTKCKELVHSLKKIKYKFDDEEKEQVQKYVDLVDKGKDFDPRLYLLLNNDLKQRLKTYEEAFHHFATNKDSSEREYKHEKTYEEIMEIKSSQHVNPDSSIVLINHESTRTGAPMYLQDFANWLDEQGVEGILFMDCIPNSIYKLNSNIEVAYHFNDHDTLLSILDSCNPDIIYGNSLCPIVENFHLYDKYLSKTIMHFHECTQDIVSYLIDKQYDLYVLLSKLKNTFFVADKIKQETLQAVSDVGDIRSIEKKSYIVPEFINQERVQKINENQKRSTNKRPLIGMCGVKSDRKNYQLFTSVAQRNKDFDFVWIGAEFEHDVENLKCIPQTDNPYKLFATLDYFFLTSTRDPCPIVVLENMLLNNKIILLENNIKYTHDLDKLENVYYIEDHYNDAQAISNWIKENKLNTKPNKTNKNKDYILHNFTSPRVVGDKNLMELLCFTT